MKLLALLSAIKLDGSELKNVRFPLTISLHMPILKAIGVTECLARETT